MKHALVAVFSLFYLLFQTRVFAYEVYEKSQDRLFGVRNCQPVNGQTDETVSYLSCSAVNYETITAAPGSTCSNYQANGCGPAVETPPSLTSAKIKPWNYFDHSEAATSYARPATRELSDSIMKANATSKRKQVISPKAGSSAPASQSFPHD